MEGNDHSVKRASAYSGSKMETILTRYVLLPLTNLKIFATNTITNHLQHNNNGE